MLGIDRVAKKLFASQEGVPSILAISFTPLQTGII
jgi:hypothetical protein